MLYEYAFDVNHKLVHADSVENGLACNCTCPCCGEKMIAKNNGEIKDHHFAHSSGSDCAGYKESLFHIWSKQIIEEKKEFTIPKYKRVVSGKKLKFSSVEIEQRNDTKLLQPDIVGVTDDGLRLWIEIFVTHKCSEEKIQLIKENGYNCIEVKIPEEIETKEELSEFLVNSDDLNFKYFINFPYGDVIKNNILQERQKEKEKKLKQLPNNEILKKQQTNENTYYDKKTKPLELLFENEIDSFIEKVKKIKNNDLFIIYQPFIKEFYPMYLEWQKNGVHGITAAERRKEFKLFENLNHKGIPYSQWPDYWKNLFFEF